MPARHAGILLLVFLISIAVRLPQLGRPLSKNHEFATATVLMVLDIWQQRGFIACSGCPSMTYPGTCDSEVGPKSYAFMQRDGARYYVSHLPLAFWAPFAVFKSLGVEPTPVPLRIINLILHALTAFFFYRFLWTTTLSGNDRRPMTPLIGASLYLLMPAPLWYHGNVYMSDMAVQLPWAWALASGARIFMGSSVRMKCSIWFLLAIAACALTEWIGILVAGSFVALAIARARTTCDRSWYALAASITAITFITVGSAIQLYAGIAGWPALWRYFTYRWEDRSTFGEGQGRPLADELATLPINLITAWGPLLIILLLGLIILKRGTMSSGFPRWAVVVMTIPAVIHLLLFLRYAGHEFAWLKLGFLLCSFSAVVIAQLHARRRWLGIALTIASGALGMAMYTWINRPGDGSATGDRYAIHQERGEFIARMARKDELIVASGAPVEPQLMYYAHRNVQPITEEEAHDRIVRRPGNCAIAWFRFDGDRSTVIHSDGQQAPVEADPPPPEQ